MGLKDDWDRLRTQARKYRIAHRHTGDPEMLRSAIEFQAEADRTYADMAREDANARRAPRSAPEASAQEHINRANEEIMRAQKAHEEMMRQRYNDRGR